MTRPIDITTLPDRYAVCRLAPSAESPAWASGGFVSVTRTHEETSIVCPEAAVPPGVEAERGWCVMRVAGPLAFGEVGILSCLAGPLATAGVPVFVISTFDTDYLLVPAAQLAAAAAALTGAGHRFVDDHAGASGSAPGAGR